MKRLILLLIAFQFTIVGQTYWSTPSIVNNINTTLFDKVESYTNSSGNHIAINSNGTIKYFLINSSGLKIRENINLDNNCEFSEYNYTLAITGNENDIYIIYQKSNKIKILKSTNSGASWTNSIQERTMANSNCNGIDAIWDDKGLHIVWAVKIGDNFETYYERYNRILQQWEGIKQVTDFDANDTGGRPSVTTSENKVHVGYNMNTSEQTIIYSGPAKTRDFNFITNIWEIPQYVEIELGHIPEPYPGAVIDLTCSNIERLTYGGGYLHLINHQLVASNYTIFHYLYYKRRAVNSNSWESEILVSKDVVFPQRIVKPLYTPDGRVNIFGLLTDSFYYQHYYFINRDKFGPYLVSNNQNISLTSAMCFSSNSNDLYTYWVSDSPSYLYWSKYDTAPLAPQNLGAVATSDYHPKLLWTNTNADAKKYYIYRSTYNGGYTTPIAAVDHNSSLSSQFFIDYTISVPRPGGQAGAKYYYVVKTEDWGQNMSGFSNSVEVTSSNLYWEKRLSDNTESVIEYVLDQNYPNPFNPSTKISFSIKEEGLVTLKVYDVLGKEAAVLVNENKPVGNYEVDFDALQLPSGVYIYKLQSGSFSDVKKMLLTK